MSRRSPPGWPAAAAVLLAVACGAPPAPLDLVVISVDTLRRDALGAFAEEAPAHGALDRLASESLRLRNAYSTAPWTLPAHASLLTGLYPDRHGAVHPRTRLVAEVPRLARVLERAGYLTVGFGDGGYMAGYFGFVDGFSRFDHLALPDSPPIPALPRGGRPAEVKGAALFDRAIAFLDGMGASDRPRFLFVQTYSVHDYFRVHPWAADAVAAEVRRDAEHYHGCLTDQRACSPSEWQDLQALYRAEVRHLDRGMARLLAALDRSGRAPRTLLVFLSDHGEGFDLSRGRISHGGRLHEDQLRIPLLIRGPEIRPGEVEDAVSLVDLMPTLLDRLALEVPAGLDGRSFASLLRGERGGPPRPVYAMDFYHTWEDGRRLDAEPVRRTPLELAVIAAGDWYIRSPGGEELYDMARDLRQEQNLAPASPRAATFRRLAGNRLRRPASEERPLDPEIERQLRALGYLD